MKCSWVLLFLFFSVYSSKGQIKRITYGDSTFMNISTIIVGTNKPLEEWVLKDSLQDSHWEIYRDNGMNLLKAEGKTKNGKLSGEWIDYDKEGNKSRLINYYQGLLDGEEVYYNTKTGDRLLVYSYAHGMRQGLYYIYHANGVKWEQGYYTRGLPDKEWKYWNKEGKLIQERSFNEGRLINQNKYE